MWVLNFLWRFSKEEYWAENLGAEWRMYAYGLETADYRKQEWFKMRQSSVCFCKTWRLIAARETFPCHVVLLSNKQVKLYCCASRAVLDTSTLGIGIFIIAVPTLFLMWGAGQCLTSPLGTSIARVLCFWWTQTFFYSAVSPPLLLQWPSSLLLPLPLFFSALLKLWGWARYHPAAW